LKVRYSTSFLGYLWSVLDPLVMSAIYWFVFTQIFQRDRIGEQPYIVFLISALLPWVWFNSSVSDFTKAFKKDSRLVRSTNIPRSIWVNRTVLSKGMEFLFSLPVIVLFAVFSPGTEFGWGILWFPVAVFLQVILLMGLGMLVAPLCALYSDLEHDRAHSAGAFLRDPHHLQRLRYSGTVRDAHVLQPARGDLHAVSDGVLPGPMAPQHRTDRCGDVSDPLRAGLVGLPHA
jgi:hypothetical protein